MYARFSTALYGYLRKNLTPEQAREIVQTRLRERETNFLEVLERSVYQNPTSPYAVLLKNAGCEYGDLCGMVKQRGLESSLCALRNNGVYIKFEEFKGREPIVRPGVNLPASTHHFDNPFLVKHFYVESSWPSPWSGR